MIRRVVNRFSELLALKERHEQRSYTRREIADLTGISLTSVQNWASNNTTRYDEAQILAFCDFFGCSPGELLVLENVLDTHEDSEKELKTPLATPA